MRMRIGSCFSVFLLLLCFVMPGCGSGSTTPPTTPTTTDSTTVSAGPTPQQIAANSSTIELITSNSLNLGLTAYGASNPAEAKEIATQIQTIVGGTLLPYLKNSNGLSTAAVNAFMKENFVKLPSIATTLISTGAAVLDQFNVRPPSTDTFMSPAESAYTTAFCQALSDGASQYLSGVKAVPDSRAPRAPGHWLNFSN